MMGDKGQTPSAGPGPAGSHILAVAEMLLDLSLDIETLGTALCSNVEVVQRHVQELQTIDLIAQKQRSLAAVLRAECPKSALSNVSLDELRSRLHELLGTEEAAPQPN